jgi:hypothetical protein
MLPFPRYVMGNQSLISIASDAYTKRHKNCSGSSAISAYLYCANKKLVYALQTAKHVFHLFCKHAGLLSISTMETYSFHEREKSRQYKKS